MNLVGTLAKVAMGVMVARGVGKMISNKGASGGGLGGLLGGQRGNTQSGELGGIGGADGVGGLLGGSRPNASAPSSSNDFGGGCGDGQAQSQNTNQGGGDLGGLGGLLGGLGGKTGGSLGSGGLGGLLGSVLSGGGKSGGLGGLLDSMGGQSGQQASGGLGGILNQVLNGQAAPDPKPDQNAQAELMLRGMINAAKSDGEFDQNEQAKILEHLGDVTDEEINFVRSEMAKALDVDGFIRSVPKGMEQQVYVMSLLGIKLDSQAEAQYLDRLARGLGISSQVANQIHAQVGVPNLYG